MNFGQSYEEKVNNSILSSVKIFENPAFGKVRTSLINGDPWFVGKDIADILGYVAARNAIRDNVDNEDKMVVQLSDFQDCTSGVLPDHMKGSKITIINESGLYSLILRSDKPEAKKFKRWVTSEVLPSLRSVGYYSIRKSDGKVSPANMEDFVKSGCFLIESMKVNLRISDASVLKLYRRIGDATSLPVPDYVEQPAGLTYAATNLLKMNGISLSTKKFYDILVGRGLMENKTRPSSSSKKGFKTFRSLTELGLKYGKNILSDHNERETAPHFYESKFKELLSELSLL